MIEGYEDTAYFSYACLALAQLLEASHGPDNEIRSLYTRAGADSATPRVAAEALFRLGDVAYKAGDFRASADAYRTLLSTYPEDRRAAEAQLQAAWSYYHGGRHESAQAMAARALLAVSGTGRFDWLYLLANCQRSTGQTAAALASYQKLLNEFPDQDRTPSVAYERLLVLFEQGDDEQVLAQGRTLTPPPEVVEDHHWLLAEAATRSGRTAEAMNWLTRIMETFPGSARTPLAIFRLARLQQEQGNLQAAAARYVSLIAANPDSTLVPDALFAAAYCRLSDEDYAGAIGLLDRLLVEHPAFAQREDAAYQKALAELKMEDDAAAKKSLSGLLREFPQGPYAPEAAYWSGVLLERAGQIHEAETRFRSALERQNDNAFRERAMLRLSAVLQKQEKFDEAARLLTDLLGTSIQKEMPPSLLEWLSRYLLAGEALPDAGRAAAALVGQGGSSAWRQIGHYLAGESAAGGGDRDAAVSAYQSSIAESASTREGVLAALALGDLSLDATSFSEAETYFTRAVELAKDPDMIDVRARSYFGLGMAAQGRQDWEEAARRFMSVGILFDDEVIAPEALYRASRAFARTGREEDRTRTITELRDRYPESAWTKKVDEE